jgi:hypothetical protein
LRAAGSLRDDFLAEMRIAWSLVDIAGPNRRGNVNFIAGPPAIYLDTASIRTHRRWERLNYVQLFTDLARDNQAFDAGFDSMGVRKSYLSPRE